MLDDIWCLNRPLRISSGWRQANNRRAVGASVCCLPVKRIAAKVRAVISAPMFMLTMGRRIPLSGMRPRPKRPRRFTPIPPVTPPTRPRR